MGGFLLFRSVFTFEDQNFVLLAGSTSSSQRVFIFLFASVLHGLMYRYFIPFDS